MCPLAFNGTVTNRPAMRTHIYYDWFGGMSESSGHSETNPTLGVATLFFIDGERKGLGCVFMRSSQHDDKNGL